jgi:DNA-binding NarL/FixJ family response regulator
VEPPPPRPRILIADARPSLRLGLQTALERDGFEVVAQAGTRDVAERAAAQTRPDACLIDAGLVGGGLAAARAIKSRVAGTEVIVMTEAQSDTELLDALRAGASGYVLKQSEPARFGNALRAVLAGEAAIPRALVSVLVEDLSERDRRRRAVERRLAIKLTTREWQVMDRLGRGLTTDEVAVQLGIAPVTVRRHVSDVVRKLGVADRGEALARLIAAER